jgi:hypothetical protein
MFSPPDFFIALRTAVPGGCKVAIASADGMISLKVFVVIEETAFSLM